MNPIGPHSEPSGPEKIGQGGEINRRDFLDEVAASALGITGLGATIVTVNYLSPNVLFEPPTRFRVGSPDDYPVDSVTYIRDQQVYILRLSQGFCAVSAVCTHLGCITEWRPEDRVIACPCHGSRFEKDGTKLAGPAPRPLPHFAIRLMPDGQLMIDKLETVNPTEVLKV